MHPLGLAKGVKSHRGKPLSLPFRVIGLCQVIRPLLRAGVIAVKKSHIILGRWWGIINFPFDFTPNLTVPDA